MAETVTTPHWTTETPTKDGWYWVDGFCDGLCVLYIYEEYGRMWIEHDYATIKPGWKWLGRCPNQSDQNSGTMPITI
jgi:hypothetical protein